MGALHQRFDPVFIGDAVVFGQRDDVTVGVAHA
jgi:hypothetical protein